jgi:YD repeat-containing protein
MIAEEGPEGRTEIGLDQHGQMISLTDARGGVSYWTWHASGQAATHKDCSGRLTRYVYDSTGALLAQTDPASHTTTYRLDEYGRLDRLTLADGSTRHWQWKAGGMQGILEGVFVTRSSAGITPAERQAKLALPPTNTAGIESKVALTRDQILLAGKVAPQLQWGAIGPAEAGRSLLQEESTLGQLDDEHSDRFDPNNF